MVADDATTVRTPVPLAEGDLAIFSLVGRWVAFLEASSRAAPNTRRQYRRSFVNMIADTLSDPRQMTEDDVVTYLATFDARGQQRGQVLRALKSFYAWAEPRGYVGQDPTARLRVRKPKLGPAPFLSAEDLERVLVAAESIDPRARPTLELMYATGARIASMVAVMPSNIRFEPFPYISFDVAKGDRPYGVPLGPRGERAARTLLDLRDYVPKMAAGRLPTLVGVGVGTIRNWTNAAGARAGLRVHPHLLRHCFATRLAESGTDIRTWIELMNHADASQFRRYAQANDQNLRAAVAAL